MQHLQGETLAERLRRGLLPVHEAVAHAIQIAGAIELFDAPWALRVTGAGRPQYDVTPEGESFVRIGAPPAFTSC